MKTRLRLFERASGVFYLEDTLTLRQASLKTKDKTAAQRLFQAQNGAHEQPALNLQLARTYLAASDPEVVKRTWQTAMDATTHSKNGVTRESWLRAVKDHAFDSLRGEGWSSSKPRASTSSRCWHLGGSQSDIANLRDGGSWAQQPGDPSGVCQKGQDPAPGSGRLPTVS